MGGFVELVRGIVGAVRLAGGKPFIFPAMGSHGGATAEGQRNLLARLGITEGAIDAPIEATMNTLSLGQVQNGAMAHIDELAASDGVAEDELGEPVAISGDTIVGSAVGAAIAGHAQQGAVYVFAKPAAGWTSGTQSGLRPRSRRQKMPYAWIRRTSQ